MASGLTGPMKAAFGAKGNYLVAEGFPGQETGGVSNAHGTTYYFDNDTDPEAEEG